MFVEIFTAIWKGVNNLASVGVLRIQEMCIRSKYNFVKP
jgi:hypothetical protein